ncbi:BolA family protein [Ketogulonicigenium vulgare]|uniref:BolA-like protein n=1 Tax=Ketogulonicigenium vulgare (strain WSH-001) TaxID=759362 RepID=F9Y7C0_KETVW|nr:BolA family protein [Ketogulonicigenium vulgare]ADO42861.1 BolA family protein [Ketogulonicigenium vulgare Y25]AEM41048.1 BolA-like protein [Ketogulonicigenium vulgare WSH-001]ALJ81194.1 BolA family transcriptional regulator [Ketogulonicigenium vulgare]ANW35059.1 BolA family transcriptional regulator [Ketogulonicigenium vulgare]AOZ54774.1 BolA family protein [Ketogulonicigenium vulgare]
MTMAEKIRHRLEEAFAPSHLQVTDDSERHRGHAGYQDGGESHWIVDMKAETLADMSRIQRHRAVHTALGADVMGKIHALSLNLD